MKPEIKKIRVKELESFVKSETFKNLETIPITTLRVKSYISNPQANPEDVALYLIFSDKKLIAFRSIFAGSLFEKNKTFRFGWCSGAWVHPDYRRKGFSKQMLNEALLDWDGKLMLTNYSPQTEILFLKSGRFHSIHQFHGIRCYLFPKTKKLISAADKNSISKILLSLIDILIALISTIRLWFFRNKTNPKTRFETSEFPDDVCYELLEKYTENQLFQHSKKELKWIFDFPWISKTNNPEFEKYPFSGWSNSFFYQTVKVFSEDKFSGFFIFSVREGHLKTLFFKIANDSVKECAQYLKNYCVEHQIEVITVYNNEIAGQLFKRKFPFLHAKKYGQKIYSSFEIKPDKHQTFQDGDGDVMFT